MKNTRSVLFIISLMISGLFSLSAVNALTPEEIKAGKQILKAYRSYKSLEAYQSYSLRPDILFLLAKPAAVHRIEHLIPSGLSPEQLEYLRNNWNVLENETSTVIVEEKVPAWKGSPKSIDAIKIGFLESIAEVLEFYPAQEIYFMGRDGENLYDLAKVLTFGTQDQARIHLLLTSRKLLDDPNYKKYLKQEGIYEDVLYAGKKILFVDVGYAGSATNTIRGLFKDDLREHFQTHLLASINPQIPSTRVFLERVGMNSKRINRMHLVSELEGFPPYFNSGHHIEFKNGNWQAMCPRMKVDFTDSVYPDKVMAVERMRDLKYFGSQSENVAFFHHRRETFRKLYQFSKSDQKADLQKELDLILEKDPKMGKAILQDFDQMVTLQRRR